MTARSPGAFMLSATFHAAVIGVIILWAMATDQGPKIRPRVLELVAGEGDNYGATVAPKLGTPGGVKVDIPAPPAPKIIPEPLPEPEPVRPQPQPQPKVIEPEPPPVTPAPKAQPVPTPAPTKQPEKKQLTPKQQILRRIWAAQDKGKKEAAKERAAEEKKLKDAARIAAAKSGASNKVSHIDAEGIAKGVVGGSSENKVSGGGGKALTRDEGTLMEAYDALLRQRVQAAIDKPPGVSDNLTVVAVVHIAANGRLSNARIVKASGSEEFDRAVIVAFSRVSMPDHPEHRGEDVELEFRTRDVDSR